MGWGTETMVCVALIALCLLGAGDEGTARPDLAADPFLRPYVERLKGPSSADERRRIVALSRADLIELHHGLGTGIRNRWLRGDRDPALVEFFRANQINDPDAMSMVVIEALWLDLNRDLAPAERAAVAARRATVARKRAAYERLEAECEAQLEAASAEFERCYAAHGLPSRNPAGRVPFSRIIVARSGVVRDVVFFEGASPELKAKLEPIVRGFRFPEFGDDDFVTLSIMDFPRCRVAERDNLYK